MSYPAQPLSSITFEFADGTTIAIGITLPWMLVGHLGPSGFTNALPPAMALPRWDPGTLGRSNWRVA